MKNYSTYSKRSGFAGALWTGFWIALILILVYAFLGATIGYIEAASVKQINDTVFAIESGIY